MTQKRLMDTNGVNFTVYEYVEWILLASQQMEMRDTVWFCHLFHTALVMNLSTAAWNKPDIPIHRTEMQERI